MLFPHRISFENYRSLRERVEIPFSRKMTFIVGPNNSGKSNILRFLAILFNKKYEYINDDDDFDGNLKRISGSVRLAKSSLEERLSPRKSISNALNLSEKSEFTIGFTIDKSGAHFRDQGDIQETFGKLGSNAFLSDFGQSGPDNIGLILGALALEKLFTGTTYLPNLRFIATADQEPPQFVNFKMPGETIAFGSVIKRLAEMDRPDPSRRHLREQKQRICDFMAYCLEKGQVTFEVPDSKTTILIDIDGDERPINAFGTGVEQLLMIGLASLGFDRKLVLIDEPELNLHPRAQKRVITYLDKVEAQFVIATHSAAVLDAADADVIQTSLELNGTVARTVTKNSHRYQAVRDLGHSPSELLQTRFAIWVEGPSDRVYLKHWISKVDETLIEGIDYTVLFYGGRVLSHHSFEDAESDLVKSVSLSRSFAVVIDSDRKPGKPNINATKSRVRDEVVKEGGLCWITEGREIENYLPKHVIAILAKEMSGVTVEADKRKQIIDPEKVNKVDFARRAIAIPTTEWPLDLNKMVTQLVEKILASR